MSAVDFETLAEQLAEIDPATLQYLLRLLSENVPAVQKIVQNVLDEPIPQQTEKRLHKPLLPKPFQPRAPRPPRQRRTRKRQELLRKFDPFPPQNIRTVTDYQNEILDLYDEARHEGEETKGRRFIRWRFIRGLEKNLTANFMANVRENVHTAFYIKHVYSCQLRNIEDGTVIVYYTNNGSHWITDLSAAEKWLSEQETKRLESDNIKRPSTKWEFVSFFNVDVKVVLHRQPLLAPCQTGCATLRVGMLVQWWRWIPIKITCVYGVALLCKEERVLIEAQQQPAVSQRVSSNSKPCQPTVQKRLWMN